MKKNEAQKWVEWTADKLGMPIENWQALQREFEDDWEKKGQVLINACLITIDDFEIELRNLKWWQWKDVVRISMEIDYYEALIKTLKQ